MWKDFIFIYFFKSCLGFLQRSCWVRKPRTTEHNILLDRLASWLKLYWTDHYLFVNLNDDFSRHTIVQVFVTSRSDYCDVFLTGFSINKLQLALNLTAEVLIRTHITYTILPTLHWISVQFSIDYNILLLSFKSLNAYLSLPE